MSKRTQRIRFWITLLLALAVIGGAAAGVNRLRKVQASATFPVARAHQSDFLVIVRCRGELRPRRSVQIYAPKVPSLRIAWLAPSGQGVKEGDPIIRFDSSSSKQELAKREAAYRQAQAALDQWVAQSHIDVEQDKSDLADAQFAVQNAQFEANLQAIKSTIDGEKAKIDLGIAQQKLKVEQATADLHAVADNSKMASLTRLRDQAKSDVDIMKDRIAQMELKAPISGFLTFSMNYQNAVSYTDAVPYKVGDSVYSGMNLGDIPDLDTLELAGRIEETDRGRISPAQEVVVRVDALPELALQASVSQISPLAETSMNEFPPTRSFLALASIQHPDPRLRPGMNGGMDIVVSRVPHAISIPTKALFTRAGKPIVYLATGGDRYRPIEVKVEARNPDEVAVSGIPANATVALVDVEKKDARK
jgi:multidrug efflux pump subunit AcrA (membrane-fusion protein)